jgi:hypothetical protein
MGFWNSFKNQMGRNSGWVVSNWIFGDKAAHRYKGTVTYENKNSKPEAVNTESHTIKEVTENATASQEINPSKQYTHYKLIPAIEIGNDPQNIDEILEKLVQYAKITPLDSGDSVELLRAYSNKIDEGIRKLKRHNETGSINDDIAYWELAAGEINGNLQKAIKVYKRENNVGFGCFTYIIIAMVILFIIYIFIKT